MMNSRAQAGKVHSTGKRIAGLISLSKPKFLHIEACRVYNLVNKNATYLVPLKELYLMHWDQATIVSFTKIRAKISLRSFGQTIKDLQTNRC